MNALALNTRHPDGSQDPFSAAPVEKQFAGTMANRSYKKTLSVAQVGQKSLHHQPLREWMLTSVSMTRERRFAQDQREDV
jgi:hypothetical protein